MEGNDMSSDAPPSPEEALAVPPADPDRPLSSSGFTPDILYLDDHVVAVNKPAGVKVHRGRGDGRHDPFVVNALRRVLGRQILPVHRLDRPTSGILVFALHREAAAALAKSFARKHPEKTYLAIVRGWTEASGLVDYALTQPDRDGKRPDALYGAVTRYERRATVELPVAVSRYPSSRYCLVTAHPLTGRMHQIRRHFAHLRHPIIGDHQHGDNKHNRFFQEHLGVPRLLLAAVELRLRHPVTDDLLELTAPLDAAFLRILDRLGWTAAIPRTWRGECVDASCPAVSPIAVSDDSP